MANQRSVLSAIAGARPVKNRWALLGLLLGLVLLIAAVVYAQTGGDPGPPPGIDMNNAQDAGYVLVDPYTGIEVRDENGNTIPVYCDGTWCFAQTTPGFEFNGCLNTDGAVCITSSNSPEADAWLDDYLVWMWEELGGSACQSWDTCPWEFPADAITGCAPWDPACQPTATPGATATPGGTPEPTPGVPQCDPPWITTGQISVIGLDGNGEGGKIAPPNPVVVGQDPEQRGADVGVQIQIPPVVLHWYEAEQHLECKKDVQGNGDGCPGPASRYDNNWDESKIDNPQWEERTTWECIEHTQTFPDPLSVANVQVSLTGASRDYILNELSQAYPGAHLKHPDFGYQFPGPGSVDGAMNVIWQMVIPNIPVADPGDYVTTVSGWTAGTPVSAPRQFSASLGTFHTYFLRVTLGPAFSP